MHYLRRRDHPVRDLLVCMGANISLPTTPYRHANDQRYFKSSRYVPYCSLSASYNNTLAMAERCQLELPVGEYRFPDFALPAGQSY